MVGLGFLTLGGSILFFASFTFLNGKIKFIDISKKILKFINLREFTKYKNIKPTKIKDITDLNKLVRLKIKTKSI